METATEKIQPNLFELPEYAFPKLSDLRSNVPEVHPPAKYPKYCPLVSHALELALLPGKGQVTGVKSGNEYAVIAPHTDDRYVFILQMEGTGIVGNRRGILANGFSLNVMLDEKFKRPDAAVKTWKEKAWNYCHFLYDSKQHCLDEYRKMLEEKKGGGAA